MASTTSSQLKAERLFDASLELVLELTKVDGLGPGELKALGSIENMLKQLRTITRTPSPANRPT